MPDENYLKESREAAGHVLRLRGLGLTFMIAANSVGGSRRMVEWGVICEIVRYRRGIMIDSGGGLGGVEVDRAWDGCFKQGAQQGKLSARQLHQRARLHLGPRLFF